MPRREIVIVAYPDESSATKSERSTLYWELNKEMSIVAVVLTLPQGITGLCQWANVSDGAPQEILTSVQEVLDIGYWDCM